MSRLEAAFHFASLSLWTRLNCKDFKKTRVYVERSKNSPLEIHLDALEPPHHNDVAFTQAIPHIDRAKTMSTHSRDSSITHFLLETLVHSFSRPSRSSKNRR